MNQASNLIQRFNESMVPNYSPLKIIPDRGLGSRVWDSQNREYIDFTGGIAVLALGHCHPVVVEALKYQADKLWHVSNYFTNKPVIELAELLCELTFCEKVFFSNSGSEANEAALKLARKYAFQNKGPEKNEIISFYKSFHGRSLFTVSAGGQEKFREGFGPLPPKILHASCHDITDLEKIIGPKTCAVIMEPIMAEGGIIEIKRDFIQKTRDLCDQYNVLLIFDEVQTGIGRTGDLFAYQGLGITPDILTTAKALGGGFPISAMMTSTKIAETFQPGSHGSTFGGNPLASAVALSVLREVTKESLLAGVRQKRLCFEAGLRQINQQFPFMDEILGKGLLIGLKLKKEYQGRAAEFMQQAVEEGLMVLVAGQDVIRFAPSLIIKDEDITQGLQLFKTAVKSITGR